MQTKQMRPAPGRNRAGREKRFFYSRHFNGNTKPTEISTLLAKKILHDVYAVMERKQKPVLLAHFRGKGLWSL